MEVIYLDIEWRSYTYIHRMEVIYLQTLNGGHILTDIEWRSHTYRHIMEVIYLHIMEVIYT